MPNLLEKIQKIFKITDLYGVLGTNKQATKKELKKCYHRRALAFHPDRVEGGEKDAATVKFQVLGQVYELLSDDGRRKEYDDTGFIDEESCSGQDKDWDQYWRLLFPKVTQKDIEDFSKKYQGSDEELADLKQAYLDGEGDLSVVMETVLCCSHDDEPRFTKILQGLIKSGELPDFDKFSKENKRSRTNRQEKAEAEAKEAAEEAKKLKLDEGEASLFAAIAQRQAARGKQANDFLAQLEAKYSSGGGTGGRKGGKKSKK